MKYLSFIRSSEKLRTQQPPKALMDAMGPYVERSMKSGVLVATGGLASSQQGFRVRQEKRAITVVDGPFTESKEVIGGWALLECASREEAVRVATEFMELHLKYWPDFEGESEVRPVEFLAP